VRALQHTQSPRGEGGGESKDIERQRERKERIGEEWNGGEIEGKRTCKDGKYSETYYCI
jgi:hypothetical protein